MVSTAGPVMMFPLVKSVKVEPKPAFKLVSKVVTDEFLVLQ